MILALLVHVILIESYSMVMLKHRKCSFVLLHLLIFLFPTGRKREWFKIEDAIKVLQYHKPVQASYFETLRQGCLANNGTPVMTTTYSESSVPDIR